jgi:hypothetical protein
MKIAGKFRPFKRMEYVSNGISSSVADQELSQSSSLRDEAVSGLMSSRCRTAILAPWEHV